MKFIVILLILAFITATLAANQTTQQTQEEITKVQQDLKQAEKQVKVEKQEKQKQSKAEKEALKQQERERKQAEKEKKAQEKVLKQQLREQEELQRQQEKAQLEQLKLQQQQELLSAQVKCEGAFALENGTCGQCSANCERCSSANLCDVCQPGFFRVISEKKVSAFCSSSIPQGYLPQLKTFQAINPQVNFNIQDNYTSNAIAVDGKRTVTAQSMGLPYTVKANKPVVGEVPVRVDVVPCRTHCQVCPEGFVEQPTTRGCVKPTECQFPDELTELNGKQVCQKNDPTVWKGQIRQSIKEKQSQKPEIPATKSLSLEAQTNRQNKVSLIYTWTVYDTELQDVTAVVLPKGNLGQKLKVNATALFAGQTYTIKCLVKDVTSEEVLNLELVYSA